MPAGGVRPAASRPFHRSSVAPAGRNVSATIASVRPETSISARRMRDGSASATRNAIGPLDGVRLLTASVTPAPPASESRGGPGIAVGPPSIHRAMYVDGLAPAAVKSPPAY